MVLFFCSFSCELVFEFHCYSSFCILIADSSSFSVSLFVFESQLLFIIYTGSAEL